MRKARQGISAIATAFVVMPSVVIAAEPVISKTYLCIADSAVGFKRDPKTQKWGSTEFNVEKKRYIVKRAGKDAHVTEFGSQESFFNCANFNEYGFTRCQGLGEIFSFNDSSLRYMDIYTIGYVTSLKSGDAKDVSSDTPYIEIGTCSPI